MSHENVEVVVKQFEGTTARDFVGVMDTWAEDVTLIIHAEAPPLSNTATGKPAVGAWFGDWFRQFGVDYRFDIEETHDTGDRVFVVVTHHGRGRHSGVPVEQRMAFVYTLRDGRVSQIEVWGEQDREAALEAVGLREEAMSQENVELTRRAFDAFVRRDRDAFVAFHDPTCEIQPLLAAVGGNYHGRDGVRRWLDDLYGAFPDFTFRVDEVRELGDRTLARARISAHGAHGMDSAAPMIDQVNWILAEIRNGRVIWWGTFRTETEALEAAGLRE